MSAVEWCPASVIHSHDPDRAGRCRWCRRRCARPVPAPRAVPRTGADLSYRYHFDPDFGSGREDVYL